MIKIQNMGQINKLFLRFSQPLVKSAITGLQKDLSVAIAKVLWVALIHETDTEDNMYNFLQTLTNSNHQNSVAIGSLYFHKMKKSLSDDEMQYLVEYYKFPENAKYLESWVRESCEKISANIIKNPIQ